MKAHSNVELAGAGETEAEPRLVGIFSELYKDFLELMLEDITARLEVRIPLAIKEAVRRDPALTREEAIKAGYIAGVTDVFRSLDAGEELIRQALEISAERSN
jgi:hypothetical protein